MQPDRPVVRHTLVKILVALAPLLVLLGCSGATGTGSAADCADLVRYDGHRYVGHGELQRMPATSGRSGTATRLSCDDGNGPSPEEDIEVVALRDVPLDRGFLSHGQLYVRDDQDFPEAARAWFDPTTCDESAPFELAGQWLGVESSQEVRFDGDIHPRAVIRSWRARTAWG